MVEQEEGEPKSVMPPEAEWPIADVSSVDAQETIQKLKDSIAVPVIFTLRPPREGGFSQEQKKNESPFSNMPSILV